jgi:hypothetical protein
MFALNISSIFGDTIDCRINVNRSVSPGATSIPW